MNDDYVASNNAPLKAEMKGDIKKTVEMVVQLDMSMQMNYVSREDLQTQIADIEARLNDRVTAGDFSDALQQFDEDIKEENTKTYDYVQSVRQYMTSAEEEFD